MREETKKIIGYTRISTESQDADKQRLEILDYCQKNGLIINEYITETVSTRKTDRKLFSIINSLKNNDILITTELSRLGRSTTETLNIIQTIQKKGAGLILIKQNIKIIPNEAMDITTKSMITVFSMMAEMERDFISLRVKAGLKAVKDNGGKLGRKEGSGLKLEGKEQELKNYLKMGLHITQIAKIMGVDRLTVNSFITKKKLKDKKRVK